MNEITVESIFGTNAGIVWQALSKNGPNNIADIAKVTSLSREDVLGALGWLGRENKITLKRRGRAVIFSLSEWESRMAATTSADAISEDQPAKTRRTARRKARAAKAKSAALSMGALKKALEFIQSEFDADREPTPDQASKAGGMGSRQLGKALSKLDIKSESVRRKSKSLRVYPLAHKSRVWELAALDEDGLQRLIDAKKSAAQNEQKGNSGEYTVFD
jgi:hypothetical protein